MASRSERAILLVEWSLVEHYRTPFSNSARRRRVKERRSVLRREERQEVRENPRS